MGSLVRALLEQADALADFDFDTPNPVVRYRRAECAANRLRLKVGDRNRLPWATPPTENENYPYRPCTANVVFPDGHHECLG
jgi:hypothetical protein